MNVPQVKGTTRNILLILFVSFCCGASTSAAHKELTSLADLRAVFQDGLLYSIVMLLGWLGMRSPLAREVTSLTYSGPAVDSITIQTTPPLDPSQTPPADSKKV